MFANTERLTYAIDTHEDSEKRNIIGVSYKKVVQEISPTSSMSFSKDHSPILFM